MMFDEKDKEIDELKKQYLNAVADYETTMAERNELKKQLHEASLTIQEMTEQDIECPSNCDKLRRLNKELQENTETLLGRILELRGQQKEFITYINSCIKELEKGSPNKLQNTINLGIMDVTKTILQKYRSIIGENDV